MPDARFYDSTAADTTVPASPNEAASQTMTAKGVAGVTAGALVVAERVAIAAALEVAAPAVVVVGLGLMAASAAYYVSPGLRKRIDGTWQQVSDGINDVMH